MAPSRKGWRNQVEKHVFFFIQNGLETRFEQIVDKHRKKNLTKKFLTSTIRKLFFQKNKEVVALWVKWPFSRKKDQEQRFMVLEQEWALRAEEKFWRPGEQKEEKFYPLKATNEEGGLSSSWEGF